MSELPPPATATAELPYSSWTAWLVTLVATSTMTISYLDRQVLAVLAPTISERLEIDEQHYGWLQSAFSLSYLVFAPLAGRMLERLGVRRGLVLAVAAWTLVSAAHALAASFAALFVLRILLGAAEAPSFPGAAATITRTQSASARARAVGVLFTGSSVGAMLAPPLATYLATRSESHGVQVAFVGVAIIGLAWIPCWLLATSRRAIRDRLDAPPASAPAASMLQLFRHPAVWQACVLVACASPLFAFVLLWGSKLLHDAFGVPQADMGRYLWIPPVFYDLGAVVFGHFASVHTKRHGERRAPAALLILAASLASAFLGLAVCRTPWEVVAAASVAMAGGGGLFAIVTADMLGRVGARSSATAGGATASAQALMYVIGNLLFGAGVAAFHGYREVILAIGVLLLPGALAWLALRRWLSADLAAPLASA